MRIVSWNVNSLKVRLPQVEQWLADNPKTDVLAMQETKLTDDNFPADAFRAAGYEAVYSGQKTYNGVAIIAKTPPRDIVAAIPGFDDPQRRLLAATVGDTRIINLYVVNGQTVGSEKYGYKLEWLERVHDYIAAQLNQYEKLVVLGDFNIAPEDRDVHDPELWQGKVLCSEPERAALRKMLKLGLTDTFRLFEQVENCYSWWDYRAAGFRRNLGLRIDLILASEALAKCCKSAGIDRLPRTWERPSDHAPVWAEFEG
ncbi:MAG TPA: exodeoxyribonuclease III [Gammaproteobacteria bacterium]